MKEFDKEIMGTRLQEFMDVVERSSLAEDDEATIVRAAVALYTADAICEEIATGFARLCEMIDHHAGYICNNAPITDSPPDTSGELVRIAEAVERLDVN